MEDTILDQLINLLPPETSYGEEYNVLIKAFKDCDVAILKKFIQLGLDVNIELFDKHTPLTLLIGTSNSEHWPDVAKLLLEAGCCPNARNPKGTTVLSMLVSSGEPDLVSLALDKGADIEAIGASGETALLSAVHFKQVPCLKVLLERGADPNVISPEGNSAVMWAAGRSNGIGSPKSLAAMKLLLKYGADPNKANNRGYTPLMAASLIRETESVRTLIEAGANMEAKDFRGETALFKAVYSNCQETVNSLINSGANINATCKINRTPVMMCNTYKILSSLLEHRADTSLADCDGYTPLHHYATSSKTEFIRLLVIHGADIERRCVKGNTPLQLAVRSRSRDNIQFFLSKKGNISTKNELNVNLLHEIIIPFDFFETMDVFPIVNTLSLLKEIQNYVSQSSEESGELMKTLVSQGGDFAPCSNGVTPLMLAALSADTSMVQFLLQGSEADPYIEDCEGRSVLSYACRGGDLSIVKLLLQRGCSVNTMDSNGNLPIFYAAQFSHMGIVEHLILDFVICITHLRQNQCNV